MVSTEGSYCHQCEKCISASTVVPCTICEKPTLNENAAVPICERCKAKAAAIAAADNLVGTYKVDPSHCISIPSGVSPDYADLDVKILKDRKTKMPIDEQELEAIVQKADAELEELYDRAQRCVDAQAHARRKYHLDVAEHGLMQVPAQLLRMLLKARCTPLPGWDVKGVLRELPDDVSTTMVPAQLILDMRKPQPNPHGEPLCNYAYKYLPLHDPIIHASTTSTDSNAPGWSFTNGYRRIKEDIYGTLGVPPKLLPPIITAPACADYIQKSVDITHKMFSAACDTIITEHKEHDATKSGELYLQRQRHELTQLPLSLWPLAEVATKWTAQETIDGTEISIRYCDPNVPIGVDLVDSAETKCKTYTTCNLHFLQNDYLREIEFTLPWKKEELPHYISRTVCVRLCLPHSHILVMGDFKVVYSAPVGQGTRLTLKRYRNRSSKRDSDTRS